ncbi:Phage-related transcriptional regulator [uncultured Candidatus Thioglobus sp.]|nr:Phage-related transcriptional regulator [uncultured Candidatus Thioglobus sp.]
MQTLIIENKEFAVIPMNDYELLRQSSEDFEDEVALLQARVNIENGDEEILPASLAEKLILGNQSKVKLWREYREISASELAKQTSIDSSSISRIESGKREPTLSQIKTLALALDVDIDDLI